MPSKTHERERLPESASLLLDVVRFTAALMVVAAHVTHVEFHLGYRDLQVLGDIAVPVFFVLSGFVIRYVTRTRETTAREYFIDRASRIYSVALPAMVFTLVVSGICFLVNRDMFMRDWAAMFNHPVQRIVFNLVFVSQAWGHNTFAFVDSPFWTLGYECVYYVFYGLVFFLRGWKRVVGCVVLAAIIGPQVLFLMPVWWMGCWIYDAYVICRGTRAGMAAVGVYGIWLATAAGLVLAGFNGILSWPIRIFRAFASVRNPLEMAGLPVLRATMFAVSVGIFTAVGLLILLQMSDFFDLPRNTPWAKGFRRIADGTFTIYLMHTPFLVLLLFLGLLPPGRVVWNVLAVVGICVVLMAAAVPADAFKLAIRRWLHAILARS